MVYRTKKTGPSWVVHLQSYGGFDEMLMVIDILRYSILPRTVNCLKSFCGSKHTPSRKVLTWRINTLVWFPGMQKKTSIKLKIKGMMKCRRQTFIRTTKGTSHP